LGRALQKALLVASAVLAWPLAAQAQRAPDGTLFNCDSVYYSDAIGSNIFSLDPTQTPLTFPPVTWGPTGNAATRLTGATGGATMALGPRKDATGNFIPNADPGAGDPNHNQLTMYHWGWDWNPGSSTGSRIKYLDDAPNATWQYLDVSGDGTGTNPNANVRFDGAFNPAGGEVNQHTGEIYIAGGLTGTGTDADGTLRRLAPILPNKDIRALLPASDAV